MYNTIKHCDPSSTGFVVNDMTVTTGEYPEANITIFDKSKFINTLKNSQLTTIHDSSPTLTVYGDLEVQGKIKTPESEVSTITMDEDDIIMLTFDMNQFPLEKCKKIIEMWQFNFPNHKVIGTIKGVKIDLIKDKGRKNNEVSW